MHDDRFCMKAIAKVKRDFIGFNHIPCGIAVGLAGGFQFKKWPMKQNGVVCKLILNLEKIRNMLWTGRLSGLNSEFHPNIERFAGLKNLQHVRILIQIGAIT